MLQTSAHASLYACMPAESWIRHHVQGAGWQYVVQNGAHGWADGIMLWQCCLLRQLAEVLVGYSAALRGHSVGQLQRQDLTTLDGQPLAPYLDPHYILQPGQQFAVRPYFVKNRQEANAGSITVTVPAHQHLYAAFCWVHLLLVSSRAGGHAIQAHLFRPLDASKARFTEQGVSSSSINSDLQSRTSAAGSPTAGQTLTAQLAACRVL